MRVAQVTKLFSLEKTPLKIFRRHEIFGDFNAVVDVANLKKDLRIQILIL